MTGDRRRTLPRGHFEREAPSCFPRFDVEADELSLKSGGVGAAAPTHDGAVHAVAGRESPTLTASRFVERVDVADSRGIVRTNDHHVRRDQGIAVEEILTRSRPGLRLPD